MRTSRVFLAVALFAVCAVLVAVVSSILFEPYGSKSEIIWHDYREAQEIDTVFIGDSIAARAFDPRIFDEELGTKAFNMSSPSQAVAETYIALREIFEQHDIKRVYLGMEFSYLQGKKDITPMRVFLREKWRTESLGEALSDLAYGTDPPSLLTSSEWVNFPFLWVKQRVPYLTPNVIVPNAKLKLTGGSLIDGAKINDPDWTYYGRGYGNYERRYNFDAGPRMYYGKAFNEPINPRKLEHLSDICSLCAENGVELVVVNVAQPEFAMISLGEGEYTRKTDAIKNVVEGAGMRYFDFNCASSELFDPQDEYFEDWQHFNIVGGTAFSNAMVSLMKRVDAGEDVSSLFESYADHVAGIQEISSIDVSRALTNEGVDLHIACYAGSKVKPEFQILAKGEGEQEYRVVRDWSADPDFRYHLEKHCVTNIRVNAREQGSSEPFERYRAFDVLS